MSNDPIPPRSEVDEPPAPRAQVSALFSDVRDLAETEWQYAKARLSYSGGVVRKAGVYALIAVVAVTAAAIALVLGLLLGFSTYWGPWVATAIVVSLFSAIALICAVLARKTARNLNFAEHDADA